MNLDQNIRCVSALARARRWACSFGIVALLTNLIAAPAMAGTYDGAMGRTNYVVMTGDVNGDGQNDVLLKAVPKVVMIPLDDDLTVPIPIPTPSPTFALISTSYGNYELVVNPTATVFASTAWQPGTQAVTFAAAAGTLPDSLTIKAASNEQATFVVSMSATTGQLQLSSTTAPVTNTAGQSTSSTPIPVAITPPHLSNPDAGTLPGALEVSSAGAAVYAIPIVVPPGSAGMQPTISLEYDSEGTNGLLGLGWRLNGFSKIHRCGKTVSQDGVNGRIAFDTNDRLCLDGKRLVLVNNVVSDANYWAVGAEYRTESESFARIRSKASDVGGRPDLSFTVETRDGKIMTFGATASSYVQPVIGPVNSGVYAKQPVAKSGAQAWAVSRISDRTGNFVDFVYEQDMTTGEHRPSAVRYGGAGNAAHASVQFTYEARPDTWKRYLDETRNDLRSRISHIKTFVGDDVATSGVVVRDYTLQYEQSPTSGRSMLASVQGCAWNSQLAKMECLPQTTFAWGKPDPSKHIGFESKGYWQGAPILTVWNKRPDGGASAENAAGNFAFTDFENDGYTDVLEKRVAPPGPHRKWTVEQRQMQQRYSPNPIPFGTMRQSYRYFHNTGSGFTEYQYKLSTGEAFAVLDVGDFNGDGSPDLLAATTSVTKICLSPLGVPGGLGSVGTPIVFNCQDWPARGKNNSGEFPFVVDILGDGRSAHYSEVYDFNPVELCIQANCAPAANTPPTLEGQWDSSMVGSASYLFSKFSEMVDFSGVGKPFDFRATYARFTGKILDGMDVLVVNRWDNLAPRINITEYRATGTATPAGSMQDFVYPAYPRPACDDLACSPYYFDFRLAGAPHSADFNGSGLNGIVYGFFDTSKDTRWTSNVNTTDFTLCLSTGRALDCAVRKKYSGGQYRSPRAVGSFVGDGQSTILVEPVTFRTGGLPWPTAEPQMCRLMGDERPTGNTLDDNMVCESWPGLSLPRGVPSSASDQVYYMDLLGTGRTQLVYYHSGTLDSSNNWHEDGRWEIFAPIDVAVNGQALDRLVKVTNGLGASSSVEYADGLPSGVVGPTISNSLTYPQHVTRKGGKIVQRLMLANGLSTPRTTRFQYSDAAIDIGGRGALGFGIVTSTDEQTGIVTTDRYRHDWPYTGMKLSSAKTAAGCVVSTVDYVLNTKDIPQANGLQTKYPFIESSNAVGRDIDAACSDLGTVVTSNKYTDGWGNLTNQTVTTVGGGEQFATTLNVTFRNEPSNWLVSLATTTKITKTHPVSGALTRTVEYDYDVNTGLLKSQTLEPGAPRYEVKTVFDRSGNQFGLINKVTQNWFDPKNQINHSRDVQTRTYDAKGRFVLTSKNALGHKQTSTYLSSTGAATSVAGPNDLTTTFDTDGFGQVRRQIAPGGNEIRTSMKACSGDCPPGASFVTITEHFNGADRINVPVLKYLDNINRSVRTLTWAFDGNSIVKDERYDSVGRLFEVDQPRFASAPATLAARHEYDILGRTIRVTTLDESGVPRTTTTDYKGRVNVLTNARGYSRTETRDVLGQMRSVLDANLGLTSFVQNSFGQLTKTTDANGNVIGIDVDLLGRKTDLRDPDLGWIHYDVDPIGRTWRQTSPKQRAAQQATTFEFDDLDRMTDRFEPDLQSHWVFDTAVKGIGQLAESYTGTASSKDYRRVHTFDNLARPSQTVQTLSDGNYLAATSYDGWSRPIRQTNQRKTDPAKVFDIRYSSNGYFLNVQRAGLILTKTVGQDAAGNVTTSVLGNGLTSGRTFNRFTGRLESGLLADAGNTIRLLEKYEYDAGGSVAQRTQYWDTSGFIETFTYDKLNRLDSSTVTGQAQQNFGYDKIGNLISKTGVGNPGASYNYGDPVASIIRPHAVKNIDGVGAFLYDDNGNLVQGNGLAATWNSFDTPIRLEKNGASSTFVYGPEHQRTRQDRSDGSTVIYAGAQEVETKSGLVTVKTYWPGGLGVEIDRPSAPTELLWSHTDRLGSPVGLTDRNGNLREKLAYDAWGKRRSVNGDPIGGTATPDGLDGQLDNRGFTGHEMLDQLDLVHMNGRIYDPKIARFLSGDPVVCDSLVGPAYNRFSYVLNNPTNLTDPTGFTADSCQVALRCDAYYPNGLPTKKPGQSPNASNVPPQEVVLSVKPTAKNDQGSVRRGGHAINPDGAVLIGPNGGRCDAGCAPPGGANDGDVTAAAVPQVKVTGPKRSNPDNINAYFDDMYPIIHRLADRMKTNENLLFALSSMESSWLNSHNRNLHNPWGLTKGGGLNLSFDSFQAATDNFESTSQWGRRLKGIDSVDEFTKELLTPPKYNSVNPNYEQLIRRQVDTIVKRKAIWLEQKESK